jgi:hypothetical protein
MKEWDLAAYQRKFNNSWTRLRRKDGEERWFLVNNVGEFWNVWDPLKKESRLLEFKAYEPLYAYVPSGFVSATTLLMRMHTRSFTVGVGGNNYHLYTYNRARDPVDEDRFPRLWVDNVWGNDTWCNLSLEKPWEPSVEEKRSALSSCGAISRKLFLSRYGVYYFYTKIGTRKKEVFVLDVPYRSCLQEIHDALRGVL